jgi:hypothetical protein
MHCPLSPACRVYAAFHPSAFEASLVRHKEGAATAASLLASDIQEGRYEPSAPGEVALLC